MKTINMGEYEFIKHGDRLFLKTDESAFAVINVEWAEGLLSRENVKFQNGRMSHDAANEVLEQSEDILLNFLCVTPPLSR